MGSAGGEGEVHSPSSMKVSATMPSKGARRTVLSSWAPGRGPPPSPLARRRPGRRGRRRRRRCASLSTRSSDLGGDEAVLGELRGAVAVAPRPLGGEAGLVALGEGGLPLVPGEAELRPLEGVVDAQEEVALPHTRAPPAGELEDAPAGLGGELGAAAGLHGAGARVRDRLLDAALLGGDGADRDGVGGEDGEPEEDDQRPREGRRRPDGATGDGAVMINNPRHCLAKADGNPGGAWGTAPAGAESPHFKGSWQRAVGFGVLRPGVVDDEAGSVFPGHRGDIRSGERQRLRLAFFEPGGADAPPRTPRNVLAYCVVPPATAARACSSPGCRPAGRGRPRGSCCPGPGGASGTRAPPATGRAPGGASRCATGRA